MKINPLFDKVVLKQVEAVETTKAGIILPGSAQEKPQVSEVVAEEVEEIEEIVEEVEEILEDEEACDEEEETEAE